MYMLFVDESGSPPPPEKRHATHFVLGGLIIHEDTWSKVKDDLNRAKLAYGVEGELKWRYFSPTNKDASNSLLHLRVEDKFAFRDELLGIISKYRSIKIISVIIHMESAYRQQYVNNSEDVYQLAYKQLSERFQYFLQDMSRDIGSSVNGIVVCDHRQPQQDERLRNLHIRLTQTLASNTSSYENIIEGLFVAPSHYSVGIQLADLVAGSVFRKYEKADSRCFDVIEPAVRRSRSGKLLGFGLVHWPKVGWK